MALGNCALCLQQGVELRYSHIISKFGYSNLRAHGEKNPNPVIIDNEKRFQSSKQMAEYLLCDTCEGILSTGCENYVSSICYQENGDCPIYNLLNYKSTLTDVHNPPTPAMVNCDNLEAARLAMFGISIFWRASVAKHRWADNYDLGTKYNELFRKYLHGETGFPQQVCLQLAVIDQPRGLTSKRFDRIVMIPSSQRIDNNWEHGFLFNGLYFRMFLGEQVPKDLFRSCIFHGNPKFLLFAGARRIPTVVNIVRKVLEIG
jgi:hypothetical protein